MGCIVLVAGLAPESFSTEVTQLWPEGKDSAKLIWLNLKDDPPRLPNGRRWDIVHRCDACEVAQLPDLKGAQEVVLIIGAGVSAAVTGVEYSSSKVSAAQGATEYPFDKERLLLALEQDFFQLQGSSLSQPLPLPFQTIKLMGELQLAYLRGSLTPFHAWMRAVAKERRLKGVITFNVDSLDLLAFSDMDDGASGESSRHSGQDFCSGGGVPVFQLHGSLGELVELRDLSLTWSERQERAFKPPAGHGWLTEEGVLKACRGSISELLLPEMQSRGSKASPTGYEGEAPPTWSMLGERPRDCSGPSIKRRRSSRQAGQEVREVAITAEVISKLAHFHDTTQPTGVTSAQLEVANRVIRQRLSRLLLGNVVFNSDVGSTIVSAACRRLLYDAML